MMDRCGYDAFDLHYCKLPAGHDGEHICADCGKSFKRKRGRS